LQVKVDSEVVGGRLSKNRQSLNNALKEFEGKRITISIELAKKKRSSEQNRYYWAGVVPIVQQGLKDAGYKLSKEDVHLSLRAKFLNETIPFEDGTYIDRFKSTTELSKSEFGDFIEDVKQWAAEYLNVIIPEPNQQTNLL